MNNKTFHLHIVSSSNTIKAIDSIYLFRGQVARGREILLIAAFLCVAAWMGGTLDRLSPHQAD